MCSTWSGPAREEVGLTLGAPEVVERIRSNVD